MASSGVMGCRAGSRRCCSTPGVRAGRLGRADGLRALQMLKERNATGRRKLLEDSPTDFLPQRHKPNRHKPRRDRCCSFDLLRAKHFAKERLCPQHLPRRRYNLFNAIPPGHAVQMITCTAKVNSFTPKIHPVLTFTFDCLSSLQKLRRLLRKLARRLFIGGGQIGVILCERPRHHLRIFVGFHTRRPLAVVLKGQDLIDIVAVDPQG